MKRALWLWKAVLPVLATAIAALALTGCGDNGEPAKPEHPTSEHPKAEKPKAEHPTSEHPKAAETK